MKKFLIEATFRGQMNYEDMEPRSERVMIDCEDLTAVEAYKYAVENYLRKNIEEESNVKFFSKDDDWFDIEKLLNIITHEYVETGASVLNIPIGRTNSENFFASVAISGKSKKYIESISVVTDPYNNRYGLSMNVYIIDVTNQYEKLVEVSKEDLIQLLIIANNN